MRKSTVFAVILWGAVRTQIPTCAAEFLIPDGPFALSADGTIVGLSNLKPVEEGDEVGVHGLSADGTVLGGYSGPMATRWAADTDPDQLGTPDGHSSSLAWGVSGDGKVIAGIGVALADPNVDRRITAFRWSSDRGMELLDPVPGNKWSAAYGLSGDGTVIAGESRLEVIGGESTSEATVWRTNENGEARESDSAHLVDKALGQRSSRATGQLLSAESAAGTASISVHLPAKTNHFVGLKTRECSGSVCCRGQASIARRQSRKTHPRSWEIRTISTRVSYGTRRTVCGTCSGFCTKNTGPTISPIGTESTSQRCQRTPEFLPGGREGAPAAKTSAGR